MKNSIEEQAQTIIDDAINRYTDYLYSTNPDKGEFDNTTHIKQITEIVKARDAAIRIDELERFRDGWTQFGNVIVDKDKLTPQGEPTIYREHYPISKYLLDGRIAELRRESDQAKEGK